MSLSLICHLPWVPLPRFDPLAALRCHREVVLTHLGPLFGLLVLLCAALWALSAYTTHRVELSQAEIHRYVQEFQSPPVADAWRRLSRAWQAEGVRQATLLAELAPLSGEALRRRLPDYQRFVLHTVEEHRLSPDIDTVLGFIKRLGEEEGFSGLSLPLWQGLFAKAGTPPVLVAAYEKALLATLDEPELRKKLADSGITVAPLSGKDLTAFIKPQAEVYRDIVESARISIE